MRRPANEMMLRSIIYSLLKQEEQKITVSFMIFCENQIFKHHKEALNVQSYNVEINLKVMRKILHLLCKRAYCAQAPESLATIF